MFCPKSMHTFYTSCCVIFLSEGKGMKFGKPDLQLGSLKCQAFQKSREMVIPLVNIQIFYWIITYN